jgi:hypothetical protein
VPLITRTEGNAEPVGDLTIWCTGGTPTPANALVPQVNITLFLNTNVTSMVTAHSSFDEALVLVDEPNSPVTVPQRPLLNCGQNGAPDNGVSGPGVCAILSNGNPADTYDGTPNGYGTSFCGNVAGIVATGPNANSYGCGRPNAFQGRIGTPSAPGDLHAISFLGVPFDPPGPGVRRFRITNVRANAASIGVGPIESALHFTGGMAIALINPVHMLAFSQPGFVATLPGPPGVVRFTEGFSDAWRDRNVAFTVGNPSPGNATYTPPWTFNGGVLYPPALAQNVPGTVYNTEDLFQWQPPAINGPPSPNPPVGFGLGPVANLGFPLDSFGLGLFPTGISADGVSSQGTRLALSFSGVPSGEIVVCDTKVLLQRAGTTTPNTGVLILTTTDANGAGVFTPVPSAVGTSAPNLVVYEVLYADPYSIEYADIPCFLTTPTGAPASPAVVTVSPTLAPFYTTPSSARPTPTTTDPTPTAVPRFRPDGPSLKITLGQQAQLKS